VPEANHTRERARYEQLLERALFELKQARDLAEAMGLHPRRIARLVRSRRELYDEKQETVKGER
jgi:plasmid maintenance system antidote protein VapI